MIARQNVGREKLELKRIILLSLGVLIGEERSTYGLVDERRSHISLIVGWLEM
jgi:hypothetical protein